MAKVGRLVKESMTAEITAQLTERPNFFVAAVARLPATDTDTFRRKLHASRARLLMVKRRLGLHAAGQLKIPGLEQLFEGSVGLVLTEDALETAKVLVEFHKAHEEQLALRGAVIDGQLLDAARVEQIAKLPPKPVLLAQVIGTIESPIANLIATVERLLGDIIRGIDQLAAQRSAGPSSEAPVSEANAASTAPQGTPDAPAPPGSGS